MLILLYLSFSIVIVKLISSKNRRASIDSKNILVAYIVQSITNNCEDIDVNGYIILSKYKTIFTLAYILIIQAIKKAYVKIDK